MKFPDVKSLPKSKKILFGALAAMLFLAFCALVVWLCMPLIDMLSDPIKQHEFELWVQSLGVTGVLVMLGIQVLQIVVAVIPGEVIQIMSGVMYGTWGGLALCLVGCVIASSILFVVIRKIGRGFVEKLFGKENLGKYEFLNNSSKLETLVFILFLIPGLPKDMLTYIVPLTQIKLGTYIALSSIGRIPGMVASTLIGSSISDANWPLIIGVFVVVCAVGLLSIWKKDSMIAWAKRRGGVDEQ